jgi:Fe-S oxidoreductase
MSFQSAAKVSLADSQLRRNIGKATTLIPAKRERASSLCGACYEVCPVKIDIPSVLVHLRGRVVREEKSRLTPEALAMKGMAAAFGSRRRYEGAQRLARLGRGPLAKDAVPGWTAMRDLPDPPKETFRDWWQKREPRPAPPRDEVVGGEAAP